MQAPLFVGALLAAGCGRFGFGEMSPSDSADGNLGDAAAVCPGFAVLCDDFETGNFNKWSFVGSNNTGSIAVTSTQVHGGTRALEASIPLQATDAERDVTLRGAVQTSGTIGVKAWINFPAQLKAFNLVFVLRNANTAQYLTLGGNNGVPPHWVSSDKTATSVLTDHDGTGQTPPVNTWVCVEMVFDFSTRRVQGFVDGVTTVNATITDPAPAYTDVAVGAPRGDGANGFHVFVDDVVIANQRVGCP